MQEWFVTSVPAIVEVLSSVLGRVAPPLAPGAPLVAPGPSAARLRASAPRTHALLAPCQHVKQDFGSSKSDGPTT